MSETRTVVQLHKRQEGQAAEDWIPLTTGRCVQMTDYTPSSSVHLGIENSDSLNTALNKIINDKVSMDAVEQKISDECGSSGVIGTAIKNQVGTVYRPQGSYYWNDTENPSVGLNNYSGFLKASFVGNVYNVKDEFQITSSNVNYFVEGLSSPTLPITILAGSNLAVIDTKSEGGSQRYRYDVLAMSVTSGGTGTVGNGTAGQLAVYTGQNAVGGSTALSVATSSNVTTLTMSGNIYATGAVTCAATNASDERLKKDAEDFDGIELLDKLSFKRFKWNEAASDLCSELKHDHTSYGVIAQQSDGVVDGLVFDMENGYKGVRYDKLIPIMAQAIKDLKREIAELKKQIKEK